MTSLGERRVGLAAAVMLAWWFGATGCGSSEPSALPGTTGSAGSGGSVGGAGLVGGSGAAGDAGAAAGGHGGAGGQGGGTGGGESLTCADGQQNGGETDVDCGGACPPCAFGAKCGQSPDCLLGVCDQGICRRPKSCLELHAEQAALADDVYAIDPDGAGGKDPFAVRCDMTTDGGGWTLFLSITTTIAAGDWTKYMVDQLGVASTKDTGWGSKPADTVERVRVEGTGWHIDMRTAAPTAAWTLDPCVELSSPATVFLGSKELSGVPKYIRVHNNKGSGCQGIGHVYLGPDTTAGLEQIYDPSEGLGTGKKIAIKGVTPASDGAFGYLATFGAYAPWPPAPVSSLGGHKTQCDPSSNDIHYRCSGFIDDPNWLGIYMYYR